MSPACCKNICQLNLRSRGGLRARHNIIGGLNDGISKISTTFFKVWRIKKHASFHQIRRSYNLGIVGIIMTIFVYSNWYAIYAFNQKMVDSGPCHIVTIKASAHPATFSNMTFKIVCVQRHSHDTRHTNERQSGGRNGFIDEHFLVEGVYC